MDLGVDYTDAAATNQAKGDALVEAIFDCRVNFEEKDVPTDNMYGVFTPEIISSSPNQAALLTPTSTVTAHPTARLRRAKRCVWLASPST